MFFKDHTKHAVTSSRTLAPLGCSPAAVMFSLKMRGRLCGTRKKKAHGDFPRRFKTDSG